MKFRHVISLLAVSVPVCAIVEILSLLYTVDSQTGFIKSGAKGIAMIITVFICAIFVVNVLFSYNIRRKPKKMPKVNAILVLMSLALAAGIFYELYSAKYVTRIPSWQVAFVDVFGLAAILFFVAYAFTGIIKFKIPGVLFAVPAVYAICKSILLFTEISNIPTISENMFAILSQCAVLFFMLQFAKAENNIDYERTFRLLMTSACIAVLLCTTYAVPRTFMYLTGRTDNLQTTTSSVLTMLIFAAFILTFMLSYFGAKNLPYHHSLVNSDPTDPSSDEVAVYGFYLTDDLENAKAKKTAKDISTESSKKSDNIKNVKNDSAKNVKKTESSDNNPFKDFGD